MNKIVIAAATMVLGSAVGALADATKDPVQIVINSGVCKDAGVASAKFDVNNVVHYTCKPPTGFVPAAGLGAAGVAGVAAIAGLASNGGSNGTNDTSGTSGTLPGS